mmetsp:Transcript_21487/g.32959  ORF Transcript_21487/g.32959 Transcript_21487/m.32959 type:complete len:93 (-) Transcript_21487:1309-1587(-)
MMDQVSFFGYRVVEEVGERTTRGVWWSCSSVLNETLRRFVLILIVTFDVREVGCLFFKVGSIRAEGGGVTISDADGVDDIIPKLVNKEARRR